MNNTGLPTDPGVDFGSPLDPSSDSFGGFGIPGWFVAVFALVALSIVGLIALMVIRGIREAAAPRINGQGRVVAKRTRVGGGSPATVIGGGAPMTGVAGGPVTTGMPMGGTSASTWYYVTIEDSVGNRKEWHVSGQLYGLVAEGDWGQTVTKGTRLIEFNRRMG
ncbi:DUF2500 domain-containing protein [Branchiibius sp. NY16-3462-2]|uniref:DUF2500 domain-containing protein n=1 Tax=Branchiibius sp. NY16-3462-2 TaxID=1807500 RepID=UPI0007945D9C|nr:DUF2500 domain-containing protein [Branchiibius sp. NY16-3462-2]KYH44864.1 hypothetical protein AZH51_01670 [Branchiibius sp. NY16-3462-2]